MGGFWDIIGNILAKGIGSKFTRKREVYGLFGGKTE
jgi:hypothetical protein